MPNTEELVDKISQPIFEKKQVDMHFTTMDLSYAYGQLLLSEDTSVQYSFSLVGGRLKGTYRFRTGFYGKTSRLAKVQRSIDAILSEFPQANAFIDDVLETIKGTKIEQILLNLKSLGT